MTSRPKIIAIIPARMGSSRFPGKPLEKILDLPMIEHVRRRVEEIELLDEVIVATCDQEIKGVVEGFGGKVAMTSDKHERCTDRIEEAAKELQADVIINIQGDEPMVSSVAVEEVVSPFLNSSEVLTSCLVYPIKDQEELLSPNIVKTVLSSSQRMLYLSRAAIPGKEYQPELQYYKQSGIMAFKKDFLHKFSQLSPTPLEAKESVDMLRVLEHDYWIQGVVSQHETMGVDVPEQVNIIEERILNDPLEKEIYQRISK